MKKNNDFSKPFDSKTVCEALTTYDIMPDYKTIPKEFKDWNNHSKWQKFQSDWFFNGLSDVDGLVTKEGIDQRAALLHLAAIQRSWGCKHEHKEAAVAYLASLWFEESSTWVVGKQEKPCQEI